MQQNNPDLTGFQNSIRKNSWQKPNSLYEMNGYGVGGDSNLDAFNRRDAERQKGRDADEEGLRAIRADLKDIAAQAHQEFVENDGTGHHGIGEAEAKDILSDHPTWKSLSDSARDDIWRDLVSHIDDTHADYTASKSKLKEETEEDAIIARYEADKEGEILADERKANIRHRESMGTQPSHPETVMDAAEALVRAYDAFKLEQEKIKAAPPGPAWPDNRPPHFRKENR